MKYVHILGGAKPIKPLRMVAQVDPLPFRVIKPDECLVERSPGDTTPEYRPVLVIDLSPESVQALEDLVLARTPNVPEGATRRFIAGVFDAIGIRAKKGRK